MPVDKLFGTILIERVIDFIILIFIMLLSVLLKSGEIIRSFNEYQKIEREPSNTKFIILGSILFIGIIIYLFQNKIKEPPFYNKVKQFIDGLKEGFKSIKNIKNKICFLVSYF